MSDRTEALTKNKESQKDANTVPEAARKLAEEFGLSVSKTNQNGKSGLAFSLPAENCGAQPKVIAQGTDLNALKQDLTRKRDAFIDRLEDEHPVDILVQGEHLNITDSDGKPLKADVRTPNFNQLTKIENALDRSLPADEDKSEGIVGWFKELFDNDKLVIGLAAKDTDAKSCARYYQGDTSTGVLPQIVIDPEVHDAESVYFHELAHHGQAGFWNSDNANNQQWKDYTMSLGWLRVKDRDLRITNDAYPQLFYSPTENNPNREWVRMNEAGNFVDAKGNEVNSEDKAQRISNDEMARRSVVGPPNAAGYMMSPAEHGAELMMFLRQNEATRFELLRNNPHAYKIAVELDQKEINGKYGVDSNGLSKKIRMPNGQIVDNSEWSRLDLTIWESRYLQPTRTNAASKSASLGPKSDLVKNAPGS
jgi:hypothetical protein